MSVELNTAGDVTLDLKNPEHWDCSWDELVLYDLRSVTKFVCKHIGLKIYYVGRSLIEIAVSLAEFNPQGEAVYNFLKSQCATPGMICLDLLSAFTGKKCCLNSSYDLSYLKHEP
ncbi:unnamed protein product [Fraxinus pennsylvanica]|uniref:Uncharacterized protein n=1 Tax=Fraxinus pennsylvanica TaxID=56036 RepID=A0AAD2DP39_9LAMI|nr:unnamed protein product [Fraxinus pennsylvanica]